MKSISIILMTFCISSFGFSQRTYQVAMDVIVDPPATAEAIDSHDDPAYKLYKEGYDLILDEQWEKARDKFSAMISKYPKSCFVDDAEYWSAYALKHTNKDKAIDAYNRFIKMYGKSSYYDDAFADLSELKKTGASILNKIIVKGNARVYVTDEGTFMSTSSQAMNISEDGVVIGEGPESLVVDKRGITISGDGKSFTYTYGIVPQSKTLGRAIRLHTIKLNRLRSKMGAPLPVPDVKRLDEESLDPQTRLKLTALYSLSEGKEDAKSFQTIKEVALNFKQPQQLREVAMDALSDIHKFDVTQVYVEIIKNDTNEDMQMSAIDYLSQREKDKNKTTEVLIKLFKTIPQNRTEQRRMIFYSIANIGNDRAIDFLADIASKSDDYNLRNEAIYYLGNIGGEKAREALLEIIKEK